MCFVKCFVLFSLSKCTDLLVGERQPSLQRQRPNQNESAARERQKDKAPRISKHLETELVNCQVMNELIFVKKSDIPSPLLCGLYHPFFYRQTFAKKWRG